MHYYILLPSGDRYIKSEKFTLRNFYAKTLAGLIKMPREIFLVVLWSKTPQP